mmetsp:Transcript_4919/g.13942  ORF Transcript_4919/g.13942 Transcript_4919/m.13942 type:complete len:233 (-) Transcript_4919:39-737(-)
MGCCFQGYCRRRRGVHGRRARLQFKKEAARRRRHALGPRRRPGAERGAREPRGGGEGVGSGGRRREIGGGVRRRGRGFGDVDGRLAASFFHSRGAAPLPVPEHGRPRGGRGPARARRPGRLRARRLRDRRGRLQSSVGADGAAAVRLRGAERARRARGVVDHRQLPLRRARRGPDFWRGGRFVCFGARALGLVERRRADGGGRAAAPLRGAHADAVPARRGAQRPGLEGPRR